jgi:hypothetical protein
MQMLMYFRHTSSWLGRQSSCASKPSKIRAGQEKNQGSIPGLLANGYVGDPFQRYDAVHSCPPSDEVENSKIILNSHPPPPLEEPV